MRFDDVWMQQWQLDKLAELAGESCNKGAAIEIGVHQGLSAIPIANAVFPDVLHAVDHWEGSSDFRPEMLERDNLDIFVRNLLEAGTTHHNILIHKIDWRIFARQWSKPVGFLHLDAEHTRSEVADQIGVFLSYMASGSIMAGDDYNWSGVHEAVIMHFTEQKVNVMGNKLWWVEFK